jgi:uncharacterized protein YfiM (DUF2279 family)
MKPPKKKMTVESSRRFWFVLLFAVSLPFFTCAQQTDSLNHKRLNTLIVLSAVGYTGTYVGLHQLWYKDSPRQSFRFFNDNSEWKQVDKLGHFYSSFYFSWGTSQALRWANVSSTKSDLIGALTGFLVIAPIEIFDGYSADYGASSGDLMADAAGSLFFLGQKRLWNEVRIIPKFSYQSTHYAALRPNILGDNTTSRILKDYNGQTYWLSVDMDKFMSFPKWLNLAIGYGANGMIYGRDYQNREVGLTPKRQYYLALDFDLSAIRTRSKFLKSLIFVANTIKIPAPTIELSRSGVHFDAFFH